MYLFIACVLSAHPVTMFTAILLLLLPINLLKESENNNFGATFHLSAFTFIRNPDIFIIALQGQIIIVPSPCLSLSRRDVFGL
jgi:hypothetical protein